MTATRLGLALACCTILIPGNAPAAPRPKVGTIYVVGNTVTRTNVILDALPKRLAPGQTLHQSDLRVAERNLQRLGIFKVDPKTGERPTVEVLNRKGDDEYKDILVRVTESAPADGWYQSAGTIGPEPGVRRAELRPALLPNWDR